MILHLCLSEFQKKGERGNRKIKFFLRRNSCKLPIFGKVCGPTRFKKLTESQTPATQRMPTRHIVVKLLLNTKYKGKPSWEYPYRNNELEEIKIDLNYRTFPTNNLVWSKEIKWHSSVLKGENNQSRVLWLTKISFSRNEDLIIQLLPNAEKPRKFVLADILRSKAKGNFQINSNRNIIN